MQKRPPVIVIMGHVDHGKTTLLDYIRKTAVAAREAGGITQAIGAYEADWKGEKVTFIDTPGHEAFQNMRAYGARVADLAILIVAADDGVKPQTKEAIQTILAAKLPYIVAINKIDKNNADPARAKSELLQNGVLLEGMGGDVSYQEISAKTGEGVPELLDLVLLAVEMEDLQADTKAFASGFVMTSRKDPRRGNLVGIVIKNGSLHSGDAIRTASASGKVKSIEKGSGEKASVLEPCAPALIIGFDSLPQVGEEFSSDPDKKLEMTAASAAASGPFNEKAVPVVLKADEAASLEALKGLVIKSAGSLPINIVEASVGNITENDVKTADASGAMVVGFRTKIDKAADNLAQGKHVSVVTSQIIYELEKAVTERLNGVNPAERRRIEILATFSAKGQEQVIGGRVVLGPVKNQESFEVMDGDNSLGEGKILNLQSQKKDIAEAVEGTEVGMLVQSAVPVKQGNILIFK